MTADTGIGFLVSRRPAGGGLVRHEVSPPAGFAASYRHPGQYVGVMIDGRSTYFVLAADTSLANWELFVRPGGDVADALLALPVEGPVELSRALGAGFPLDEASTRRLVVIATGSGIAAVRPVLTERLRSSRAESTEVFLGVRMRADLPIPEDITTWRAAGVRVTVCVSRETVDEEGVVSGYVQHALRIRAALPPTLTGGMIFAAGAAVMVDEVRALARWLGVDEADVRTNF